MKIKLNDYQMKNISANSKKNLGSKIRIKPEQIGVGKEYSFTTKQIEDLKKGKKNGKSVLLNLSIEQVKTGGFFPALIPIITAAAALMGGGAAIANVVIDKKDKDKIREETNRHHLAMEKIISEKATSVHVGNNLRKKKPKKKVHFKKY